MIPTEIAGRWQMTAVKDGIDACARQIRDDVLAASDQNIPILIGALRLLNSGLLLSYEDARSLKLILTSVAGDRLATEIVETEQILTLRIQRDELRHQYDQQIASSSALAGEQVAYQDHCVRKNILERAIRELQDRLNSLLKVEN